MARFAGVLSKFLSFSRDTLPAGRPSCGSSYASYYLDIEQAGRKATPTYCTVSKVCTLRFPVLKEVQSCANGCVQPSSHAGWRPLQLSLGPSCCESVSWGHVRIVEILLCVLVSSSHVGCPCLANGSKREGQMVSSSSSVDGTVSSPFSLRGVSEFISLCVRNGRANESVGRAIFPCLYISDSSSNKTGIDECFSSRLIRDASSVSCTGTSCAS